MSETRETGLRIFGEAYGEAAAAAAARHLAVGVDWGMG